MSNSKLDDIEFDFKPINQGLGFHHNKKKGINSISTKNITSPKTLRERKQGAESLHTASKKNSRLMEQELQAASAGIMPQVYAWAVDMIILIVCMAMTVAFFALSLKLDPSILLTMNISLEIVGFSAALFAVYYLLYFTVLDLVCTPGKFLFDIKVVRNDNSNVSMRNTFVRSFVTLLSSLTLFLPLALDFQGKLSDTKVVK